MKKVTEKELNKMKELYKKDIKFREIARQLNLAASTVIYHLVPKVREERKKRQTEYFRNLPKEKKKEIYERRKDYVKHWLNEKYRKDKEFREKKLKYSKEYYKRNKNESTRTTK